MEAGSCPSAVFLKDTSRYWYKAMISRDEAIATLKDKPPGSFIVRDSNSFPGAYGLALKVDRLPAGVQVKSNDGTEMVRHFLIEPTSKGVKLKGCNNEPVFPSLAALVYQHSITPLALPCKLTVPDNDPVQSLEHGSAAQALLEQGAACNVTYVDSVDCESLTGPEAVRRAVGAAFDRYAELGDAMPVTSTHFKVSSAGITLTDNQRRAFFRRHYATQLITHCGLDPEDRRWTLPAATQPGAPIVAEARLFAFVARKTGPGAAGHGNQCHVFAELEPEQPSTAVVNFVTKVLLSADAVQQRNGAAA